MPTTAANGLQLYYEVHGHGEPLLCIQGLASDVTGWRGPLPRWAASHRTIVFDNRDVGRSSYVEHDYGVAEMAADTLALADALELDRFHLLGISMGGAIAQQVVLTAPERIATLTLCVSYGAADRWMRERARLWQQRLAGASEADQIDELLLMTLSPATFEQAREMEGLRALILDYPYRQRPNGFRRQLGASTTHSALDALSSLDTPTHVIGAEQDVLVPVWYSRQLADAIPGARLTVIEGSGHSVNLERARELADAVQGFLQERPLTTA